jgi:hypothetical protein
MEGSRGPAVQAPTQPPPETDISGLRCVALALTMRQAALDRLEWQITELRADLERAARFAQEGAAILDELAAYSQRPTV